MYSNAYDCMLEYVYIASCSFVWLYNFVLAIIFLFSTDSTTIECRVTLNYWPMQYAYHVLYTVVMNRDIISIIIIAVANYWM